MVREAVRGDGSRSKERDRLLRVNCQKVPVNVLFVTNHGIDVGHLGLNESWFKLCHIFSVPIHEDDVDNVVTDVSLPLHLLFVLRSEGEEGGDVEHDLVLLLPGVDTLLPSHVRPHVQPPSVSPPAGQPDLLPEEGEEVVEPLRPALVTQQLVIHHLAWPGQDDPKLEVHASFLFLQPQDVLLYIWGDNFPRDLLHLVQVAVIGEELEMCIIMWH